MSKKKKKQQSSTPEGPQGFSPLGFFRKYEKTFLLVLLAPALLSMGVTGVMLSVFQDPGDVTVGRLFGEPVTQKQFEDVASLYRRVVGYVDDESAWQFYALLRAADDAGIDISDREVGDEIRTDFRWEILRHLSEKEVRARGVDVTTEEGQRLFNQVMLQKLDEAEFDESVYREILEKRRNIDVGTYEKQRKRSAKVSRLLDVLREMAVVPPERVWEEFQSKHHQRVAEYVALSAEGYAPKLDETDEKSPHFVSAEQVDAFFDDASAQGFYDEPRRVDLEYLSYSFNAAKLDLDDELGAIDDPELEAYYEANPTACVAAIGTDVAFVELGDPEVDLLRELLIESRAADRVDEVMNRVADLVEVADEAGAVADLAGIREQVQEELQTTGIVKASTGLIGEDAAATNEDIGGSVTRRWFRSVHDEKKTSDVLAGDKAWFVLRSADVRDAKRLTRQEVEGHLRDDYAKGTLAEQKAHYDQHKHEKYMRAPAFRVEYAVADAAAFGDDSDAAKAALVKALEVASGWERGFNWGKLDTDADIASAVETGTIEKIDRDALDAHEILGGVASDISFSPRKELSSTVAERKDGKGWVIFRKVMDFPQEIQSFDEVKDTVAADLATARGLERAEEAAIAMLDLLANKTGEALTAKLAELGLEAKRTQPFQRSDVALEEFPAASGLINMLFSDTVEIDGAFEDSWNDEAGSQVLLVRVAEKLDAPADKYESAFPALRSELLTKVRGEFAEEQSQRILLEAKGIHPEHVAYATALRDGPGGQTQVTLRQIFLPPDRDIVNGWLEEQALAKAKEVRAALDGGKSWGFAVSNFSEDENTSALRGALPPVGRGDLIESHGIDFVEAIFELPEKQVSQPILSKQGYHLVQKWQTMGDGKVEFRHILVKTDPKLRQLPDEVLQKAKDASRATMDKALARLEKGEPFVTVAEDVGDLQDPIGRGQEFSSDYLTEFELTALEQVLEWEPAEGTAEASDDMWMPPAVQLTGPDGKTQFHWFACERDRADDSALYLGNTRRDRIVYHIATDTQAAMDSVRKAMTDWMTEEVVKEEGRPGFPAIRRQFQDLARERSSAPDAGKGGSFGIVRLSDDVRGYGRAFLEKASRTDGGAPVEPGHRTGVFEDEKGFHILLVDEVETKQPTDRDRFLSIARVLMQGTDWN
jgi:hypothetical protein